MTNVFGQAPGGSRRGCRPDLQAVTASPTYTCTSLAFTGARQFTMVADTDAPRRMAYGETVTPTATATITVPEDVTTSIRDVGRQRQRQGHARDAADGPGLLRHGKVLQATLLSLREGPRPG